MTAEQLDLFAELDGAPAAGAPVCTACFHEGEIHYPAWAGTKGCRVFTCSCRGWAGPARPLSVSSEREEWAARFERAPWSRPYATGYGPAGTVVNGWVCPACGKVEDNACSMNREHGYAPDVPGQFYGQHRGDVAFGEACTRQRLLASQERARAAREATP